MCLFLIPGTVFLPTEVHFLSYLYDLQSYNFFPIKAFQALDHFVSLVHDEIELILILMNFNLS